MVLTSLSFNLNCFQKIVVCYSKYSIEMLTGKTSLPNLFGLPLFLKLKHIIDVIKIKNNGKNL